MILEKLDPLYSEQYEKYISKNPLNRNSGDSHIFVDAHVLATPVIADLEGDGVYELIVPVSYFYDGFWQKTKQLKVIEKNSH